METDYKENKSINLCPDFCKNKDIICEQCYELSHFKPEYQRYCGCHPDTVREVLTSGSEGLTIAGVVCLWRVFVGDSWQSMCSMENQEEMGCKKVSKEVQNE